MPFSLWSGVDTNTLLPDITARPPRGWRRHPHTVAPSGPFAQEQQPGFLPSAVAPATLLLHPVPQGTDCMAGPPSSDVRTTCGPGVEGGLRSLEHKQLASLRPEPMLGPKRAMQETPSSIPGSGRSPGEGIGYALQYSGLENSMDCIVCGVRKESDTTERISLSLQIYYRCMC